jgi:hypothetical protein
MRSFFFSRKTLVSDLFVSLLPQALKNCHLYASISCCHILILSYIAGSVGWSYKCRLSPRCCRWWWWCCSCRGGEEGGGERGGEGLIYLFPVIERLLNCVSGRVGRRHGFRSLRLGVIFYVVYISHWQPGLASHLLDWTDATLVSCVRSTLQSSIATLFFHSQLSQTPRL